MLEQFSAYLGFAWSMICFLIVLLVILDFIRWQRLNKKVDDVLIKLSKASQEKPSGCSICGKEKSANSDLDAMSMVCQGCQREYGIEEKQFELENKAK